MVKIIREKILNHTVSFSSFRMRETEMKGTEWVPMALVGNKLDLHMQRAITKDEGMQLASQWRCAWIEASARHNENVTRAFELCIEQIEKGNTPPPAKESRSCTII
jgi:Ras homolog enriched in brain